MGMCEAVVPTCIGTWLITPEDVDELSPYRFDAERTLNRIFKVGQGRDQRERFVQRTWKRIFKVGQDSEQREQMEHFVQRYCVPMFVNHAMSHLCTLKDIPKLKERETLLNVLQVGIVGI
jgi:hypothetical protein